MPFLKENEKNSFESYKNVGNSSFLYVYNPLLIFSKALIEKLILGVYSSI